MQHHVVPELPVNMHGYIFMHLWIIACEQNAEILMQKYANAFKAEVDEMKHIKANLVLQAGVVVTHTSHSTSAVLLKRAIDLQGI